MFELQIILALIIVSARAFIEDRICGIQKYMAKIKGGVVAELDEFPWMVLLMYETPDGNLRHGCGGALIDKGFSVLTAAHCCTNISRLGQLKYIRLGEYNIETDIDCIQEVGGQDCAEHPVDIEISQIIIHPNYTHNSWNKYHDIAILKLKNSPIFSDFIQPICLPEKDVIPDNRRKSPFIVSGWGRTDLYQRTHGNIQSPIKLKLALPLIHNKDCEDSYNNRSQSLEIGPGQICAGGEEFRDSCIGDSGNGLMRFDKQVRRWVIIGIVSFGWRECGVQGVPGIYTNVIYYLDWIHKTLE